MQIIAYITMILNHWFNIYWLGLAMPIFAYSASIGMKKTGNLKKYILRVLVIGLVSQFFWPFRDGLNYYNDMLALGFSMLAIEDNFLSNLLKCCMFIGWVFGVIGIEFLFLMILYKEGKPFFYFGVIIYCILKFVIDIGVLGLLLSIIIIELHEKKMLTRLDGMKYKFKYLIYPLHLLGLKCLS